MRDETDIKVDVATPTTPHSLEDESPSKLGSFFLDSPVKVVKGNTEHESVEIGIIEPNEAEESRGVDDSLETRDAQEQRVEAAVESKVPSDSVSARQGSSDGVPSDEETDKIIAAEPEKLDATGDETEEKNPAEDGEEKVVETEERAPETEERAPETEAHEGEEEVKTSPESATETSPESATETSPESATETSPESATETSPESATEDSKAASTGKKFHCDYDKDPTFLFLDLQKKEWDSVMSRAAEYPIEARTWVTRREKSGKLRWKLLPIHAALIFKAPENVIESLLGAYPRGAQSKDDQGMLPLHLAFRHGSTEGIVNLLLLAFPQSVDITDRKGRVPLVLAQASASPNRDAFVSLLERGRSYYAEAVAATSRTTALLEQRAKFDTELQELEAKYQVEIKSLNEEKTKLSEKVDSVKGSLNKYQTASEELQHLVNNLEAQICDKADSERMLAMKIASLDQELQDMAAIKEELIKTLETKLAELSKANELVAVGTEKDKTFEAMSEEKEALQKDFESLKEEKERMLKASIEMKEERAALTLKIEELEEVNETLKIASSDIGKLSKRIDELEEANRKLQESKDSMTHEFEYAKAKVITMTRDNEEVKVGFENTLTEWKQKASNYENMIASLEVMLKEKAAKNEQEIEKLETSLKEKTESYEMKIEKLEHAVIQTRADGDFVAREKDEELKKKVADHEEQLAAMKAEWTKASSERAKEHRKEVDLLTLEVKKLQNGNNQKTTKELKKLKKDWANAQARAAVLEAQLNSKLENERDLATQVSTLAGKLADTTVENTNTSSRFTSLIQTLEDKCKKYKSSAENEKSKVGALEVEKSMLRSMVNELGNKLVRVSQVLKAQAKSDGAPQQAAMQDLLASVLAGIEKVVDSESELAQPRSRPSSRATTPKASSSSRNTTPRASSRATTPRASSNSKKVPPPVNTNFSQVEKAEDDARNSLSEALRALEVSKDTAAPRSALENVPGISPVPSDEGEVICSSSEEGGNASSFETTGSDDFTC